MEWEAGTHPPWRASRVTTDLADPLQHPGAEHVGAESVGAAGAELDQDLARRAGPDQLHHLPPGRPHPDPPPAVSPY